MEAHKHNCLSDCNRCQSGSPLMYTYRLEVERVEGVGRVEEAGRVAELERGGEALARNLSDQLSLK